MTKHRNKHFSTKLRGVQGSREFDFTLSPRALSWKEKGKAESERRTATWVRLIGFALVYATPSPVPTDYRNIDVELTISDRTLQNQTFRVWFGEKGLIFVRHATTEHPTPALTWRNVLNYGLTGH